MNITTPDTLVLERRSDALDETAVLTSDAPEDAPGQHASATVPRIEVGRRVGGARAFVLVRSDPPEARSTTVWFTDHEWALIQSAVLAAHGLRAIDTPEEA